MKIYIVISRCEDEPNLLYFTESALLKSLNDGNFNGYEFLNQSDWAGDLMEFPSMSAIIFGGEIVIPKTVQKVTEYKL